MKGLLSKPQRSLGDRIKRYERVFNYIAVRRTPLMIRVDGRAFHTLTKGILKPFDDKFINAMLLAAKDVAKDIQGFKVAYIQSDEVSFCLTDYDSVNTEGWFDYELPKVISLSAAMMSVSFNIYFPTDFRAVFDSRAFTVPPCDVVNAFLWRMQDWKRNSLQMYARSFFSHAQLRNKKGPDIHEMLYSIGKNWSTDLSEQIKNGTFLIKSDSGIISRVDILPDYNNLNEAIGGLFELPKE